MSFRSWSGIMVGRGSILGKVCGLVFWQMCVAAGAEIFFQTQLKYIPRHQNRSFLLKFLWDDLICAKSIYICIQLGTLRIVLLAALHPSNFNPNCHSVSALSGGEGEVEFLTFLSSTPLDEPDRKSVV